MFIIAILHAFSTLLSSEPDMYLVLLAALIYMSLSVLIPSPQSRKGFVSGLEALIGPAMAPSGVYLIFEGRSYSSLSFSCRCISSLRRWLWTVSRDLQRSIDPHTVHLCTAWSSFGAYTRKGCQHSILPLVHCGPSGLLDSRTTSTFRQIPPKAQT